MLTLFISLFLVLCVVGIFHGIIDENSSQAIMCFILCMFLSVTLYNRSYPPPPEVIAADAEKERLAELALRTPEKFSEKDGCVVYRFQDQNRYHYFTKCDKDVTTESSRTVRHGKSSHTETETIVTSR